MQTLVKTYEPHVSSMQKWVEYMQTKKVLGEYMNHLLLRVWIYDCYGISYEKRKCFYVATFLGE